MRAQALNTHVHLRTQNKKIPHIYTLTPFSCNWLCTCLGAVDKCQLPWVTEANLTLHSLQIDCVVIVQLFLNLNLLRVHSGFTHFILLAIPYSECSLKILPYLQISQNFWLGTLPMLNIHKYTDRQKLQGSQCNDLVKTSQRENYFAVHEGQFQKAVPRIVERISDPAKTWGWFSSKVWTRAECQII